MKDSNEDLIQEYILTRGLGKRSYLQLKGVLKHYCKFHNKTMQELLDEADAEEEQGIRWKKSKLKRRLILYMNYCKSLMTINSAKHYVNIVKMIYNHHEISIGKLPPFNNRNAKIRAPITAKDLPTKQIIHDAVEIAEPLMKALILFLVSTGMSKVDALNLTINDFIIATAKYHNGNSDLSETLSEIKNYDGDVIPVWNSRRQKTGKFFITFCTPEATMAIISYLELRQERLKNSYYHKNKSSLELTDKLFKIASDYVTTKFIELNTALGLGTVGNNAADNVKGYNRLRCHMLRKFHASNLKKFGMDTYSINIMQGKSNGSVDDVYFFEDEEMLLKEYISAIEGVLILTDVREINVYSDEYLLLQKENIELKERFDKMQDDIDEIREWYIFDDD